MQKLTSSHPTQHGLVISYFGNSVAVEGLDKQVFQCHLKRNQTLPVVGDRVQFRLEKGDIGVIESIEERKSILARGDAQGKMKPIAANVDIIMIVMSPPPIFSEYLIDRYLIAAELLKIQPILVLNKIDLLDAPALQAAYTRLAPYQELYSVIYSSAITHAGLDTITSGIRNHTAVLVGPSGVGKSSIIAALGVSDAIRIGETSAKGAGKHTTTATRLYHLPDGGDLIDSPGVREFSLWPISKAEILQGFKEFAPFAKDCKFRDCEHQSEPGCNVKAAVLAEKISSERFKNYQTLLNEANKLKNSKYKK